MSRNKNYISTLSQFNFLSFNKLKRAEIPRQPIVKLTQSRQTQEVPQQQLCCGTSCFCLDFSPFWRSFLCIWCLCFPQFSLLTCVRLVITSCVLSPGLPLFFFVCSSVLFCHVSPPSLVCCRLYFNLSFVNLKLTFCSVACLPRHVSCFSPRNTQLNRTWMKLPRTVGSAPHSPPVWPQN